MESIADAVCCLLREDLVSIHQICIEQDFITLKQRERWEKLFKSYHTLGGNGMVKDMNEEIRDLIIRDEKNR